MGAAHALQDTGRASVEYSGTLGRRSNTACDPVVNVRVLIAVEHCTPSFHDSKETRRTLSSPGCRPC